MFLAAIGKRRRLKGAAWAGLFPSILQFQAAECEIIFNGMLGSETVEVVEGNGSRVPDIPASGEGANRER